jgi:hypothetical protein
VKEDNSLELTKFQDSVFINGVIVTGYDWEYLIEEKNYELTASFGISFYIDFFYFFYLVLIPV